MLLSRSGRLSEQAAAQEEPTLAKRLAIQTAAQRAMITLETNDKIRRAVLNRPRTRPGINVHLRTARTCARVRIQYVSCFYPAPPLYQAHPSPLPYESVDRLLPQQPQV